MTIFVTYLITGASRGIGLAIVKQLLTFPENRIVATVRDIAKAKDLASVKKSVGDRLSILELDADCETSIKAAAAAVEAIFPEGLDVLINNAGVNHAKGSPIDYGNMTNLNTTAEELNKTFVTNVIGPILVIEAFVPLMKKAPTKKIVNISSILGSLTNNWGGGLSYRVSKAALNMASDCIAKELGRDGFIVIPIHPGWVRTDLGGHDADMTPEESAAGVVKVISGLGREDNTKFYNYDGSIIPW